jgi:oxygen-independent coproporphyrinogen III oxidase
MAINVYVHVPFCNLKCHYCGFYSLPRQNTLIPSFLTSLTYEIEQRSKLTKQTTLGSIYFGGGTPSLLSPTQLATILTTLKKQFHFRTDTEITVEANPETVRQADMAAYKSVGVTRISLGLQAWQDSLLSQMGRSHTQAHFLEAYQGVRQAGITNCSVDVMFGVPHQTERMWQETIEAVITLRPEHISCYSLQLVKESFWGKLHQAGRLRVPDEQIDRNMYHLACKTLEEAGYQHYELSNWSLPGYECRHNVDFWQSQDYIGYGPGAFSWFCGQAYYNQENLAGYLHDPLSQVKEEDGGEEHKRWLMLSFRLIDGFDEKDYYQKWGHSVREDFPQLIPLILDGRLIQQNKRKLSLTPRGLDVYDAIMEKVLATDLKDGLELE